MRICKVDGCNEKHVGHGYCQLHLRRYKRTGDPLKGGRYGKHHRNNIGV